MVFLRKIALCFIALGLFPWFSPAQAAPARRDFVSFAIHRAAAELSGGLLHVAPDGPARDLSGQPHWKTL